MATYLAIDILVCKYFYYYCYCVNINTCTIELIIIITRIYMAPYNTALPLQGCLVAVWQQVIIIVMTPGLRLQWHFSNVSLSSITTELLMLDRKTCCNI